LSEKDEGNIQREKGPHCQESDKEKEGGTPKKISVTILKHYSKRKGKRTQPAWNGRGKGKKRTHGDAVWKARGDGLHESLREIARSVYTTGDIWSHYCMRGGASEVGFRESSNARDGSALNLAKEKSAAHVGGGKEMAAPSR